MLIQAYTYMYFAYTNVRIPVIYKVILRYVLVQCELSGVYAYVFCVYTFFSLQVSFHVYRGLFYMSLFMYTEVSFIGLFSYIFGSLL